MKYFLVSNHSQDSPWLHVHPVEGGNVSGSTSAFYSPISLCPHGAWPKVAPLGLAAWPPAFSPLLQPPGRFCWLLQGSWHGPVCCLFSLGESLGEPGQSWSRA